MKRERDEEKDDRHFSIRYMVDTGPGQSGSALQMVDDTGESYEDIGVHSMSLGSLENCNAGGVITRPVQKWMEDTIEKTYKMYPQV